MTIETRQDVTRPRGYYSFSLEALLSVLIILAAALLRWLNLGVAPLSTMEAPQAMAAWHIVARDTAPGAGVIDSLLVFAGTVVSFAVSSPGNAAARFMAALGGTLLVMSPLLFRNRLGRIGTLLCMALLALSPSAVITSRQMTGVGLSLVGIAGMLAAVDRYLTTSDRRFAILAGVSLAVALLADFGSLAIVLMLAAGAGLAIFTAEEDEQSDTPLLNNVAEFPWLAALIGLGTTLLLLSTLFYLVPNGLGAAADQTARFFGGLVSRPPDTPYLGLVILAYDPLLLLLGLIGAWFASQSRHVWLRFLAGWGIASVVVSLLYPGALPAHSLWSVVPLAALTALVLVELLSPLPGRPTAAIIAHAAGTAALIAMFLGALGRQLGTPQVATFWGVEIQFDIVLIAMSTLLGIVAWLTIASIWGRMAAWHGLGLGVAAAGMIFALGLSAAAAFTRPTSPFELFNRSPADPGLSILIQSAEEVSFISDHDRHDATIIVQAAPNGALAWALKDFRNVRYVTSVEASTQSVMVITPVEGSEPVLGSSYVGQSFVISQQWSASSLDFFQFLKWLIYHTAAPGSATQERVILWVREDIYQLTPDMSITP